MIWWSLQSKWSSSQLDQIIEILPRMPNELQLHPVKLKCKLESKTCYMDDMINRDHFMSSITWLKAHNSHCENNKLNEHWYSDIAAGEFSLQLDESDNHVTINEDIAHKQSQNITDMRKVTQNTDNTQVPYTTEITSTNVENIDTQNDEDTEEAEKQIAINHRQELTGDLYHMLYSMKTWKIKSTNVLLEKITFPNIFYWTMIF